MEKRVWISFGDVVNNFFGNRRAENYKELVEMPLIILQIIGANTSITVRFLPNHLDTFPDNSSNVSDEHSEQFYQDIKTMEEHYQRQWNKQMMPDLGWSIKRDLNNIEHELN